ncbi:MAG: hypothetical protein CFE49_03870 [Pseudomonas sp. PGPPP3]|nr:MAG: hypothetical protein CFE49_03870 [Pseudomonas sp. PGPPP3]
MTRAWTSSVDRTGASACEAATAAGPAPQRLSLHIGHLNLPGLSTLQARQVADALRSELARLLAGARIEHLARSTDLARLDAGSLRLGAGQPPAVIGAQLAGALAGALLQQPALQGGAQRPAASGAMGASTGERTP